MKCYIYEQVHPELLKLFFNHIEWNDKHKMELAYSKQSLKYELSHLQQDQELLTLQQKHLNDQVLKAEKTHEMVDAKQAHQNTLKILGKIRMYSYNRDSDAEMKRVIKRKDGKNEALNEKLLNKKSQLPILARVAQLGQQKYECIKLQDCAIRKKEQFNYVKQRV